MSYEFFDKLLILIIALAVGLVLAIPLARMLAKAGPAKIRADRAEGALLRQFNLIRAPYSAEGEKIVTVRLPVDELSCLMAIRQITNDWFDEAMLGYPAKGVRDPATKKERSFVDEGAKADEARPS